MRGLPLRPLGGAVLLKLMRPTPEVIGAVLLMAEGAVLLKSRRPPPKAVGGGTTEVEKIYP